MNSRLIKMLVLWNVALTLLFLLSLAFHAAWVSAANDPPVRVFMANADDQGGDHNWNTEPTGLPINSTVPVSLVSVRVNLDDHRHTCLVTGSATAERTSGGGLWNYGLNMDTTASFLDGSARIIEFADFGTDTAGRWEVSTIAGWDNLSGKHKFHLLANKNGAGDPESRAFNASIIVACFKTKI
jgi:hypothetical protein